MDAQDRLDRRLAHRELFAITAREATLLAVLASLMFAAVGL